jgi:hypothetical protein
VVATTVADDGPDLAWPSRGRQSAAHCPVTASFGPTACATSPALYANGIVTRTAFGRPRARVHLASLQSSGRFADLRQWSPRPSAFGWIRAPDDAA